MFDQAKAEQVFQRISLGDSVITICDELKITRSHFYTELAENPQMQDEYARAMERRADNHADRIEALAAKVEAGEIDPNAARVAIDARKWTASKLRPKRYGDRIQHEGDMKLEITLVDATKRTE